MSDFETYDSLIHPVVPILNGLLGLLIYLDAPQLH